MATVIEGIKFYTVPEVAEALDITAQTVRAYIKQGKINSQRIGKSFYITERSLREFTGLPDYLTETDYQELGEKLKKNYVKANIGEDVFYMVKDRALQIKNLQEIIKRNSPTREINELP